MHISITGNLGSGKSTVCRYLNSKYGFEVYSTGKIQREIARSLNISTLEMNFLMKDNLKYDHMIDDAVASIASDRPSDDIIFDSRLAWNFAPASFKVFLLTDIHIAAERVWNDHRGEEETYASCEDAMEKLKTRAETESERYKTIYGVDYFDLSNYDLVIDTSFVSPKEISEIIFENAQKYFSASEDRPVILLSPRNLFPTRSVCDIDGDALAKYREAYANGGPGSAAGIEVARYDHRFFIIHGHVQVLAGALNNLSLLPVNLLVHEQTGHFSITVNNKAWRAEALSYIHEFEEMGKFQYKSYPDFLTGQK